MKFALWSKPYNFFFLAGPIWGITVVTLWIFYMLGITDHHLEYYWHGYEMFYGFISAIVVGFLLTASANWSGKSSLSRNKLILLSMVWLSARMFSLVGYLRLSQLALDTLFFALAWFFLLPYIANSSQKRNWGFLVLIPLLWSGSLLCYLGVESDNSSLIIGGLHAALNIVMILIVVISGRVIPFFSKKALSITDISSPKILNHLCWLSLIVIAFSTMNNPSSLLTSLAFISYGILNLTRLFIWKPIRAIKVPILFVLYVAYFWLSLGFVILGLGPIFDFIVKDFIHMVTIGGIGLFILGMISRVPLGHGGFPIKASKTMICSYTLLCLSMFCRLLPQIRPEFMEMALAGSGILWASALALYVLDYWKILLFEHKKA